jgi:nitrogen fixation-related uncharacterized protein
MFITFWIIWSFIGLTAATLLFYWSVKTRQFNNSRRAALMPFDDVKPTGREDKPETKNRLLFWSMMFLLTLSLLLIAGTIMMIV